MGLLGYTSADIALIRFTVCSMVLKSANVHQFSYLNHEWHQNNQIAKRTDDYKLHIKAKQMHGNVIDVLLCIFVWGPWRLGCGLGRCLATLECEDVRCEHLCKVGHPSACQRLFTVFSYDSIVFHDQSCLLSPSGIFLPPEIWTSITTWVGLVGSLMGAGELN